MEKNAYKELEAEIMANRQDQLETVKSNLLHTREILQTLGDIIDLYFPKAIEVILNMSEKNTSQNEEKLPQE